MMRALKWFFLWLPVAAWVGLIGTCQYRTSEVDSRLQDADGLVWGTGEQRRVVHTRRRMENELATHVITVMGAGGDIELETMVRMDHDMFGVGFVKAMQADSDAELEVVAWGSRILDGESFFLDFSDGKVTRRAFKEAHAGAKELTGEYQRSRRELPYFGVVLFLASIVYYLLYLLYRFVSSFVRGLVEGWRKAD